MRSNSSHTEKKVIIIGATTGIGRALAKEMHSRGYSVGVTGRRIHHLQNLKDELGERIFPSFMDVTRLRDSVIRLHQLIRDMGGMDIIVLNAGISNLKKGNDRETELQVVDVNIRGFVNLASESFSYFEQQGHGQVVGVSSIASMFGWGLSAPYNASKAFVRNYLQGYRQKANHSKTDITVTDLQPGFVDSEMTRNRNNMFWVATAEKAAGQMADTIEQKSDHAYITQRWRLIAWLLKVIPDGIWNRM